MKSRQPRIIAGRWRGRRLPVLTIDGLRPTPDRIRETLFNWLSNDCPGSHVLDCFAGTGVLSMEAVSRGAVSVVAIERNQSAAASISRQIEQMGLQNYRLWTGDSLQLFDRLSEPFDIVFVDPPYAQPSYRHQVLRKLVDQNCLASGAKIYLEWPAGSQFELPDDSFQWLRRKKAGQVEFGLAEWLASE